MARAIWKGAISFGLVNIPVELYPAEDHKEFKLAMLDKNDFAPVGYKRYNKRTGKEIAWNDIVKGYEYDKDQYVVLSDEDFRRANVKASRTIDIRAFVPASEIPPQFFETPYYLAPVERGQKVYALLRDTLKATDRVAVAQLVIRTTQHLASVVPVGQALMLNTLRYADELRPANGLELPPEDAKEAGVTAKEIELARRLVDDMTEHWQPAAFHDTYHEDLMRRINEKIERGETTQITRPEEGAEEPRGAQVIDLAALLKQSLERAPRKAATPAPRRAERDQARQPAAEPKRRARAAAAKREEAHH